MMMGMTRGCGFGGTIYYDLDYNGRRDKDARILASRNVPTYFNESGELDADPHMLSRSFRAQAMLNPDVKKCVKHIWISYAPEDLLTMVNNEYVGQAHFLTMEWANKTLGENTVKRITDMAMIDDAKRFLRQIGYDKTQVLIVRHSEKNNPHMHVIVNMVDDDGNRLKDYKEIKRGRSICEDITKDRHYHWGEHKSKSTTKSNRKKAEVKNGICRTIFQVATTEMPASMLKAKALGQGIDIKFKTDFKTGKITGLSFGKDGLVFKASDVDSSLSAKKLFPNQIVSGRPLSSLSPLEQSVVKAGGLVKGFNDQRVSPPVVPEPPAEIKASQRRERYQVAIKRSLRNKDLNGYACNVAALALDPLCGPEEVRAKDVSTYIRGDNEEKRTPQHIRTLQGNLVDIIRKVKSNAAGRKDTALDMFLLFWEEMMRSLFDLRFIQVTSVIRRNRKEWLAGMARNGVEALFGLAIEIVEAIRDIYREKEIGVDRNITTPAVPYQNAIKPQTAKKDSMTEKNNKQNKLKNSIG